MEPPFIKAELQVRGMPSTAVAELVGVSKQVVSRVIHGRIASRRVANEIARITGIPVTTLWPGRYETKPRRRRVGAQKKTKGTPGA